jgi:hypothetical protein
MTTVKSLPRIGQRCNVALVILAFAFAIAIPYGDVVQWLDPTVSVLAARVSYRRWPCV